MNLLALTMTVVSLVAAPDEQRARPVSVRVVAVQALTTGRRVKKFDPGLEEVRSVLARSNHDTFKKVKTTTVTAPYGKESRVPIDAKYTLYVTPLSKESGGRIKVRVRVTVPPKDRRRGAKPINALTTTIIAAPGRKIKLQGLPLDEGELILVLSIRG